MTNVERLPRNWFRNFRAAAAASEGARNALMMAHPGYDMIYTHFLGDALPGEWAAAKTNGTSAAVTVASSQLTCTTGTDDNGYAGNAYGLFWTSTRGFYMESAQAISSVADAKFEVGFTDATADAGAVNNKATPTATADDFCVICLDTDDDAGVDVISGVNTTISKNANAAMTVVGGTNFRTEFRTQDGFIDLWFNGARPTLASAPLITTGDLITPWWFAQARAAGASKVLTVEYAVFGGPSGLSVA